MATITLTKDNFEEVITSNDMVIIDFWAPWCGPCRGFAPVFEAASARHTAVVFAKVNTEDEQALAAHFNIRSIPTLAVFRERVMIFSQAGALPGPALEQLLADAQALDMSVVHAELLEQEQKQEQPAQS